MPLGHVICPWRSCQRCRADAPGDTQAELHRPASHRFVDKVNAASCQQLLNHTQAQRKTVVQPHRITDRVGRKSVAGIDIASLAGALCWRAVRFIPAIVAAFPPTSQQRDSIRARQAAGAHTGFKVWETVTGNATLDRLAAQIRNADVQSLRPLDHQQRDSTRAARWSCFTERYKLIKANVFC